MEAKTIEKEMVPYLLLKKVEKNEPILKEILQSKLQEATNRGNLYKSKCTLFLQSTEGIHKVHTTIWYASESHICLKGGITIPIHCIVDVLL